MKTIRKTLAQLKGEDVDLRQAIHHYRINGLLNETVRFTILRAKVRNLIWKIEQNILIVAVLVFVAGFVSGCCTVKGLCDDTAWAAEKLSSSIKTEQQEK